MVKFRMAGAAVVLFLISACGSPSTGQSAVASPSPSPTATPTSTKAVLVGHSDNPPTVTLTSLDGSVVKTLPGVGAVDEHAVGAYLVLERLGSSKAWTVDASGAVRAVAPTAAAILSPPTNGGGWTPPLIVDHSTAVIVRCTNDTCTADAVDLLTGAVRPLLTAPQTHEMALTALTVLDVTSDRKTVWLSKVTPTGGITGRLEIVGINLQTGTVSSQGNANALAGAEVAITPDGKSLAGQEDAGTNSNNLAIRHLHVVSLGTKVDSDVQGAASYAGEERSPSVLFAPGGASVAWWGGLDNGTRSFVANLAATDGAGRTLFSLNNNDGTHEMVGVLWVDPTTMVVQTDTTTTPGSFTGSDLQTFTINTVTGNQTLIPAKVKYLDGVLY